MITFTPQGDFCSHLHIVTLAPEMWVPECELLQGRSIITNSHLREPLYVHNQTSISAFDEFPFVVPEQYGGWSLEGLRGAGGLIASAQAMLEVGSRYNVWYPGIGRSQGAVSPGGGAHFGAPDGSSKGRWSRGYAGDIAVYAAVNVRNDDNGDHLAGKVRARVATAISNGFTWPTETSGGFWGRAGSGTSGAVGPGGHHDACRGIA